MSDDEKWSALDSEMVSIEAMGVLHPLTVALFFVKVLMEDPVDAETLRLMVTPESADRWGDFSGARAMLDDIENPGFGSLINQPKGASDVGYLKILRGVEAGYEVTKEEAIMVPAMVTLIWRPDRGTWLVHQIGQPAAPEEIVHARTSPNEAPVY